jgi:hypothetical protein
VLGFEGGEGFVRFVCSRNGAVKRDHFDLHARLHVVEPLSVRKNVDEHLVFVILILSWRRKEPKMVAVELYLEFSLEFFFFGFLLVEYTTLLLLMQLLLDLFRHCVVQCCPKPFIESYKLLLMVPLAVGVRFELISIEVLEVSALLPNELVFISEFLIRVLLRFFLLIICLLFLCFFLLLFLFFLLLRSGFPVYFIVRLRFLDDVLIQEVDLHCIAL